MPRTNDMSGECVKIGVLIKDVFATIKRSADQTKYALAYFNHDIYACTQDASKRFNPADMLTTMVEADK